MPAVTTTTPGSDTLATAIASKTALLVLGDRASLRGHPALINVGPLTGLGAPGSGSLSGTMPLLGLDGIQRMTDAAEATGLSETAISSAKRTVTIAKKGLRHAVSDELAAVDPTGSFNAVRLAQSIAMSASMTFTEEIASHAADFSTESGTSGAAFDHDMFMAAKQSLNDAGVPGPYLAVLYDHHFSEWMIDLEGRGGLTQWQPAAAEMQVLKGRGFKGTYDGIEIYTSSLMPASGSDRVSMMFGVGAIGYAEQDLVPQPGTIVLLHVGPLLVEAIRGDDGTTSVLGWYMLGTIEIEDARGTKITALAA
jgi:hypothetical protein